MKRYTSFMAFHVTQVKYVDFLAMFDLTYCCSQLRGFHLVLFQKLNERKKDEIKKDFEKFRKRN